MRSKPNSPLPAPNRCLSTSRKPYEKVIILVLTNAWREDTDYFTLFSSSSRAWPRGHPAAPTTTRTEQRPGTHKFGNAPRFRSSEDDIMAGRKWHRWVFSWLCRWFPGGVRVRRRPVVRYAKPMLMLLEERSSPTALSGVSLSEFAPPPSNYPA